MKLKVPEFGSGKTKQGVETFWLMETYTDADWAANKKHRKSTSSSIHLVNGSLASASSRTQQVIALPSAESELHAMVSGCSDEIFIKRCLEFLTCGLVTHHQWTDNSAARMIGVTAGCWSNQTPEWTDPMDPILGAGTTSDHWPGPDSLGL